MKSDYTEHLLQEHERGRGGGVLKKICLSTISLMPMPKKQVVLKQEGHLTWFSTLHRTLHLEKEIVSRLSGSLDILFKDLQEERKAEERKTDQGLSLFSLLRRPWYLERLHPWCRYIKGPSVLPTECAEETFIMVHNLRRSLVDCWKSMHEALWQPLSVFIEADSASLLEISLPCLSIRRRWWDSNQCMQPSNIYLQFEMQEVIPVTWKQVTE